MRKTRILVTVNNYVNGSGKYQAFLEKNNFKDCYFGHIHDRLGHKILNGINYYTKPMGTLAEWEAWGFDSSDVYENLINSIIEIK